MKGKIFWLIVILLTMSIIILWVYIYIQLLNKPIVMEYNEAEVERAMKYHGILFCQLEQDGNFYFFRDGYKINLLKTYKERS